MKNRQYSVKVFETSIEDEEKFILFMNNNSILFKDHIILIKGEMSEKIEIYLKEKPFIYLHNIQLPVGRTRKALEEAFADTMKDAIAVKVEEALKDKMVETSVTQQIADSEIKKLKNKLDKGMTVIDTMIRSGQELKIDGDLLLLNRVNSAATVRTTGNLIITQVVEGALRCDGNFMMITVSPKANIIFNGVEVDNTLLENKLNRIELKNREIYITPVIKKEINWA